MWTHKEKVNKRITAKITKPKKKCIPKKTTGYAQSVIKITHGQLSVGQNNGTATGICLIEYCSRFGVHSVHLWMHVWLYSWMQRWYYIFLHEQWAYSNSTRMGEMAKSPMITARTYKIKIILNEMVIINNSRFQFS